MKKSLNSFFALVTMLLILADFRTHAQFKVDLQYRPGFEIIGHFFSLAQTNAVTPDPKYLGFENDLVVKYNFSEWGVMESGYSFFLPTEVLKTIQNVQDNKFSQFFYLQLVITSNLFKQ